jgi:hypothetical protein
MITSRFISEMPHGGMKGIRLCKDMSSYSFRGVHGRQHVMFDITGAAD